MRSNVSAAPQPERAGILGAFEDYVALVKRLGTREINRSENDLSSNLGAALSSFGLHGIIDTGSGSNRAKRPDIALYADLAAADLGSAADIIIEAKKPNELAAFTSLAEALASDELWYDKFVPYLRAHAEAAIYFVLTTLERFLILPISTELRFAIQDDDSYPNRLSRLEVLSRALTFDLTQSRGANALGTWCATHLTPIAVTPPGLSSILDIRTLRGADALEEFASTLADVVVGPEGLSSPGGALLATINITARALDDVEAAAQRALVIYTMAANGGMTVEAAQAYLAHHLQEELSEFISASVHSLVGRLFAIKAIEDGFCVGTRSPLIARADWVFHSERFDQIPSDRLAAAFFTALDGHWIVKLHGGESQQFHYTGINRPSDSPSLVGPNNLGDEALALFFELSARGQDSEAILFYVAGIYNSQIAEEYLTGGGGSVMRIPVDPVHLDFSLVERIIATSRELRNLHWLMAEARGGRISAELAELLLRPSRLQQLEFEELTGPGGRFLQRRYWRPTVGTF
jgi:hypothetical protein